MLPAWPGAAVSRRRGAFQGVDPLESVCQRCGPRGFAVGQWQGRSVVEVFGGGLFRRGVLVVLDAGTGMLTRDDGPPRPVFATSYFSLGVSRGGGRGRVAAWGMGACFVTEFDPTQPTFARCCACCLSVP